MAIQSGLRASCLESSGNNELLLRQSGSMWFAMHDPGHQNREREFWHDLTQCMMHPQSTPSLSALDWCTWSAWILMWHLDDRTISAVTTFWVYVKQIMAWHLKSWHPKKQFLLGKEGSMKRELQGPQKDSLSGTLNQLNAILSLLRPLDRYRAPSAIGTAIGKPYLAPISHPHTGRGSQPPRSKPLKGLNRAMVVLWCLKPYENKHETKIR